ncbi:hypothetical protein EJB05_29981, partial [Eragrostis curvula]
MAAAAAAAAATATPTASFPSTRSRRPLRSLVSLRVRAFNPAKVAASDPAPAFKSVTAFAPATVANLGPGFDFLGCAVADAALSLGDTVTATIDPSLPPATVSIASVTSPTRPHLADRLSKDPLHNCAGIAAVAALRALGIRSHVVSIRLAMGLPLGSGLGSSAASAAAAAKAVDALFGSRLHRDDLLLAGLESEKAVSGFHADNIAPAILGGLVLVRNLWSPNFAGFTEPRVGISNYEAYVPEELGGDGLPISVDWRKAGAITPIQSCCWAMAATAGVESANYLKTGKLIKLSEQQLLDCCDVTCNGCHGGFVSSALNYIMNGGLVSADVYPYVGHQCDPRRITAPGVTIDGYQVLNGGCEQALKAAVAEQPVIALITIDAKYLQYRDGIFEGPNCLQEDPNHAVLVIGYDTCKKGKYWIVKDSHGVVSGIGGYTLISREVYPVGGTLGIAKFCMMPIKTSDENPFCTVKSESEMVALHTI